VTPLEAAARAFRSAGFALVVTGAGVSAESGVPTFRGAGGWWRSHRATDLATPEAFARDPRLVWDWYLERRARLAACEPNAAHVALAAWSRHAAAGGVPGGILVTQNVDGLHERAGHEGVVRFHGSIWRARCADCERERDDLALVHPELPRCAACGGPERPAVVWFGEAIPGEALAAGFAAAGRADVVLVAGTSGVVYPAASLVETARDRGAEVLEVNPDEGYGSGERGAFGGRWFRRNAAEAVPAIVGAFADGA
jgi:NAD-dependent deacetylase